MSFAAKTILKPISMATNGCLISSPSLLTTSKISCSSPYTSIPYKPIIKFPSLFCLKRKEPFYRVFVIASHQEENNPVILEEKEEEKEEEGQELQGNFNWGASENDGDGYVNPIEEAKVYVGNLPYDVNGEELAKIFQQAGVVEIAEVICNKETDQSRGFGFVTMSTEEEAERAVEMLHRYDANGRLLAVYKASPRGLQPEPAPRSFEPSYTIYAGGLPWTMDDSRLEQIFSEHGKVVNARVVYDKESGRSRGFGFVVMSSESEMKDAIEKLDGQSFDGRAIRVNAAEERQTRSSF